MTDGLDLGRITAIGVGPGDPNLMTLKAVRLLQQADIIVYPALEQTPSLAREIAAPHLPENCQEYCLHLPMSPDPAPAQKVYDQAVLDLIPLLHQGKSLAILCEGDPLFYGSFMYLLERFMAEIPEDHIEIVPGVSSLMACAAVTRHPLAARNDMLTIVPAPSEDALIEKAICENEAIAFMKIGRHFERLVALLKAHDQIENAVYIERATLPTQKMMPLSEAIGLKIPYFSMILWHRRGRASAMRQGNNHAHLAMNE